MARNKLQVLSDLIKNRFNEGGVANQELELQEDRLKEAVRQKQQQSGLMSLSPQEVGIVSGDAPMNLVMGATNPLKRLPLNKGASFPGLIRSLKMSDTEDVQNLNNAVRTLRQVGDKTPTPEQTQQIIPAIKQLEAAGLDTAQIKNKTLSKKLLQLLDYIDQAGFDPIANEVASVNPKDFNIPNLLRK